MYQKECDYSKIQIIQYFILLDLGICVKISDYTTSYFYGSLFSHCSSVPLIIMDNKVYIRQDKVNIVATGTANLADMDIYDKVPIRHSVISQLDRKDLEKECNARGISTNSKTDELRKALYDVSFKKRKRNYR